jgi:predicted nuclease with TOPRIM domain
MSRRPPVAAPADARPDGPSRRSVIGGATVAPLIAAAPASAGVIDPCINACEHWLTLHAEHKRLANRWCDLEAELERTHNYLSLSRRKQRLLPQAHELEDIDDRLEELHEEMQTLLALLPTMIATSALGLAGKLAVAAIEVCPEENPEAHHLIASVLRDFKSMPTAVA